MNSKQLAEFYGISTQAVNRWDSAKRHRKTIQAEADVTPLEWQLVGEISQLCYLYNAQNWFGSSIIKTATLSMGSLVLLVSFFESVDARGPIKQLSANASNTAEMKLIKLQLEKLIY